MNKSQSPFPPSGAARALAVVILVVVLAGISWWIIGARSSRREPAESARSAPEPAASAAAAPAAPAARPPAAVASSTLSAPASPSSTGNPAGAPAASPATATVAVATAAAASGAENSPANAAQQQQQQPPLVALSPPSWKMASSGKPAVASLSAGGLSYTLIPNQTGDFQRVRVPRGASVQVSVSYPNEAGRTVIASMQDGGSIDGKGHTKALTLDAAGNASFDVKTTGEGGIARVLLTNGSDRKVINIWGGEEAPLKTAAE